jgi:hypothetical protein
VTQRWRKSSAVVLGCVPADGVRAYGMASSDTEAADRVRNYRTRQGLGLRSAYLIDDRLLYSTD